MGITRDQDGSHGGHGMPGRMCSALSPAIRYDRTKTLMEGSPVAIMATYEEE
jgi:hypothetical protein